MKELKLVHGGRGEQQQIRPKDKCPCGSGRKYKKCCGIGTGPEAALRREENYALIRRTEAEITPKIFGFAVSLGEDSFEEGLSLFLVGMEEEFQSTDEHFSAVHQMLASWLLFNWPALENEKARSGRESAEVLLTPADLFMKAYCSDPGRCKRDFNFHDNEIALIQAGRGTCFSWYVVEAVNPGMTMLLRDFFTDETIEVYEHTASEVARVGDCILTRVLTLYGVSFLFGCFPYSISPREVPVLLQEKEELSLRVKSLIETTEDEGEIMPECYAREIFLRTTFVSIALASRELLERKPVLNNTDGDRLEPYEVHFIFKAGKGRQSREALLPILKEVPDMEAKQILEPDEFPIEFPWCRKGNKVHAHWDNTIVGHFRLEEDSLIVTVNSKKRREKVRRKIRSLLGDLLEESYSEPISITKAMSHLENNHDVSDPAVRAEIEAQMQEHFNQYINSWCTEPIQALGGQTPFEAAKTERGRELLHALFHHYEQRSEVAQVGNGVNSTVFTPDVSELKARLGLFDEQQ